MQLFQKRLKFKFTWDFDLSWLQDSWLGMALIAKQVRENAPTANICATLRKYLLLANITYMRICALPSLLLTPSHPQLSSMSFLPPSQKHNPKAIQSNHIGMTHTSWVPKACRTKSSRPEGSKAGWNYIGQEKSVTSVSVRYRLKNGGVSLWGGIN